MITSDRRAAGSYHHLDAAEYAEFVLATYLHLKELAELSYHRYGGVSAAALQAIATRAEQHQLATSMLDWWFDIATHQVLLADLTTGRNSSWQGRALGRLDEIEQWQPRKQLVPAAEVKFNRQWFRFIQRGAVRMGASGSARGAAGRVPRPGRWLRGRGQRRARRRADRVR